ncbi:MAG TPA: helix-turn-helix domain-containing GNAT family N-acetyltransferase [Burkholderiales bacterium]|nr:helix-turn-helix domain-containing GNAT family N-acetyltransferase [Burkholderiales bacterium]
MPRPPASLPHLPPPSPLATVPGLAARAQAMRRFNRFYTRQIGALREGLLQSPYSLTQVRLLYELAHRDGLSATTLGRELGLDGGYLSRTLAGFEKQGLLRKAPAPADARQNILSLTPKGRKLFAPLEQRSQQEAEALLGALAPPAQARLVEAMQAIEQLVEPGAAGASSCLIRSHQPGDIGWVISRHGALYVQEYGWDISFEALVAEIAGRFISKFDPQWEYCWIAERDGVNVGSVFLVRESKQVAKLRLLIVDPAARGIKLGQRLVDECIRFARSKGYRKLTLWTNDCLHAARRIYQEAGFVLVKEEKHHSFGVDLVGQNWELKL